MSRTKIKDLVRKNISVLKPYSSARDEYTGSKGIFLDANENPFGNLNRYPDPHQRKIKEKLSKLKKVSSENIFIGNGSDEVIDLIIRIFCNPGKDKVIIFPPTYGMYEVAANINDVKLLRIPLEKNFQIDLRELEGFYGDKKIKIIFICNPNNPTGNTINNIERILKSFKGIVFVDEAYLDFSTAKSLIGKINKYPNLVVSQTFSKARSLAAARVGVGYASKEIIGLLNKVKPPYNVSEPNQREVLKALDDKAKFEKRKSIILKEKASLEKKLSKLKIIKKIYPSDANFFLVETTDADGIYNRLIEKKIITRNRSSVVKNCLRITVGSPAENKKLLKELNKISR